MDPFVISARKYRPQRFEALKGQDHVTTTLKNAIRHKQLAQVFLFCGPRGTGKTSCARILAKAINCLQLEATGEPCNSCKSCDEFQKHTSLNIHELDGASHNSVEDVHQLITQVRYHTPSGKRIFIIDEVHMLSNAAFNALLKTLEEPPAHVVFILATTEKSKIIPTVLSRCQIFDFHRIKPTQIASQLRYIAQQEHSTCEQAAIDLISQKAEGSLRDALSMFDLIATFEANKTLTYKAALSHLCLLDEIYYFRMTKALHTGQVGEALTLYDEIIRLGFSGSYFVMGLGEHLRNLLVFQLTGSKDLLNLAKATQEQYKTEAAKMDKDFLCKSLDLVHECGLHYKNSQNKRLHVELMLIKAGQVMPTTLTCKKVYPTNPDTTPVPPANPVAKPSAPEHLQNSTHPTTCLEKEHPKLKITTKIPIIDPTKSTTIQKHASTTPNAAQPSPVADPQPLAPPQVDTHWAAYREKLKKEGDLAACSLMQLPREVTKNTITISLVSTVQEDILLRLKPDLLHYLRKQLKNDTLEIATTIQKKAQTPPYTNKEKFLTLAKKFPQINTLQQALALDPL